jgi:two-component system cell cycle sensor histidine kinase/response regulator CckA
MVDALSGPATQPKPKGALVRLFGAKPQRLFDDLAGRSDSAMRALFDGANSGLLLIDGAGRIARANPTLRATLAADVDLTAGAAAALIFAAEDRVAAWQTLQALLAGGKPDGPLTARLRLADPGSDRRTDIGCRLVQEEDGSVSGVLMRITDITAQVRLEAQLAQSRELEAVGHLVGGVAHDFNNLLTAILGAVELAQERDRDAPTGSELEQIRRSAERGAALVRNLLALGRQQYLQATPLDMNAALQDFAAMIRPALGKGITLDLALEQPGRRVRVDPGQLDQVLMNLAMNAGHAMPDGGTLTLRTGRATLYREQTHGRETIPPGRYVTVTVQDTGSGIPAELLGRIFEPFFTTRRARGGSGLGLATAHGIIRQSGGFLTVESEVGKGTTFRIYLPREEALSPAKKPAAAASHPPVRAPHTGPPPGSGAVRRVLLVDDEDAVRRITARALTRQGWQVLQAESAEAALALLDADPGIALTALVSDVVMPGKDGAALVDEVRARYPALPAILVSGYAEGMLAERAAKAIAFLGKPYTPRTLLARLAEIAPEAAPCVMRSGG